MKSPKISIIIPIYNDELYLNDALYSIQNQIFIDFECLCVNDGSTDRTEEIIDEFVKKDSRFIKINRENGGVSAARNTGLNAAKGEYVFFIDHDDIISKYTLKKLFDAAQKSNADLVRGRMMMISENCKLEHLPEENRQNTKQYFYQNPLTDYYKYVRRKNKQWYYIWQCLFKKSVLDDVRFFEKLHSGGEDYLFMFDVVGKIKNFVQIQDVVACHRRSKISFKLSSHRPKSLINISEIVIPYIYQKYALNKNIDKRLLWWVYHKEAYAVYRFLIRDTIRKSDIKHQKKAREVLLKFDNTPEFNEIKKRWSFRQKIFFRLFLNEKIEILKVFKKFM